MAARSSHVSRARTPTGRVLLRGTCPYTSPLATGPPTYGAYCASKGGLIRYLESLRAELRSDSIVVSTVSPGYLRTALTAARVRGTMRSFLPFPRTFTWSPTRSTSCTSSP